MLVLLFTNIEVCMLPIVGKFPAPGRKVRLFAGVFVFIGLAGNIPARADFMGFLTGGQAQSDQNDRAAAEREERGFESRSDRGTGVVRIEKYSPSLPASSGSKGWKSEQNPGGAPRPAHSPVWFIASNLAYPQSESSILSRLGDPTLDLDGRLEYTDYTSWTTVILDKRLDPRTDKRQYIVTGVSLERLNRR
ncbi:hypothetical protein [Chroococcidiopsis sp.]|uniref:hypothetical protein n=1 Tax=Chroococcidiopsis sp. TaxID=3088168 RepID=UPI003F3C9DAA